MHSRLIIITLKIVEKTLYMLGHMSDYQAFFDCFVSTYLIVLYELLTSDVVGSSEVGNGDRGYLNTDRSALRAHSTVR